MPGCVLHHQQAGLEQDSEFLKNAELWSGSAGSGRFWEQQSSCADLPQTTPPERWDADAHYAPPGAKAGIYARFGAYCAGLQHWDAGFYGLPTNEALAMDPHTRVLLDLSQVCANSLSVHGQQPFHRACDCGGT